ncbi:metallophosphoesterase [Magnetovibrio sp.]|uniref:metallophosphoesterase n=1 Tax=Magnetovibrio sp. TaxID=2024836 RepID=UPI002F93B82B
MNEIQSRDFTTQAPCVPEDTRVYAIGDIHGRLDLLNRLLDIISEDAADAPQRKVLVTLGDYVDRGPDSAGVIERLSNLHWNAPFDKFELRFLKGNHELLMEHFLEGRDDGRMWLGCGGEQTLKSYGANWTARDAAARVPERHRRFIAQLSLMHREGDYAFAHAGVRPGVDLEHQRAEDILWIRARFLNATRNFGAVVVHGHTPVDVPDVLDNRIAIDTRAWASGTLTALVLEGKERRFLST